MKKFLILILSLSVLFIVSCKNEVSENDENDVNFLIAREGEVSVPLTAFTSLDPLTTENISYFYLSSLVYEGLYTLDENFKPIKQLAEEEYESGNSLTIRIKDGVTFHDGSPLQSKDVVFSLNHLREIGKGAYFELFKKEGESFPLTAEIVDNTSVRFNFNGKGPFLKEYLIFPIVSANSDFSKMPLGTGPFAYENYQEKKELKLKRYERYYNELPTLMGVRGIVMEDQNLIYTSLETGRVQASYAWGENYYRFYNNEKYRAKTFPSNKCFFLYLNTNGKLADNNLRIAINEAINKDSIIRDVFFNHGIKTTSFLNPNHYLYNLYQDKQNLEKAKSLLKEEYDPDYTIYYYEKNEEHSLIATKLKQDLENLGLNITLKGSGNLDFNEYVTSIKDGAYDIALLAIHTNIMANYPEFLVDSGYFPYVPQEITDFKNALIATKSQTERIELHKKLQTFIKDNKVFIPLIYTEDAFIYSKSIVGEFNCNSIFPYRDLKSAYFTSKNKDKENLEEKNDLENEEEKIDNTSQKDEEENSKN